MHKLLNYLFGWDYIYWSNTAASGIARVFVSKDNRVYYYRYKSICLIDEIRELEQVIWLTCKPEKYFNKDNK